MLGQVEVAEGERPLSIGGTKQRAVLAMLALRVNNVVSTDFLVDGLWGDSPPPSAVNVVQVYVSRLRKVLSTAQPAHQQVHVVRRRPGYLLVMDADAVDVHRFERLARQGAEAVPSTPGRAAVLLREALALWRGPPMAEFSTEPFANTEIPRLEEQRLAAVVARVDADLALGRHPQLVAELEDLLVRYPLNERLHGQLILALYRAGRQVEALQTYQRTRRRFVDELGIDPGRELQARQTAVLAQDTRLDWVSPSRPMKVEVTHSVHAGATPATTSHPPALWNAPPRNPRFTGRDQLLVRLHEQLRSGQQTLMVLALYGLGGVGKSQIAIEYAHRYAADYDLVWWIDAQQPVLIPHQFTGLATRLDLPTGGTASDAVRRVMTALAPRDRWLLIFDNAELPADIAEYRPACRGGHTLVTSRSPGWGALGGRVEVDVLDRSDTIALLQAQIPALTTEIADELAAELGDLPLAAAQAAAYLEQTGLDPADYLRRFRGYRPSLLSRGDVLGYQGRVDTTWLLALQRLRETNPAAVAVLELASFLSPEPILLALFTQHPGLLHEPLRTIVGSDADALSDAVGAMVAFSLARRHPDGFQLHRLVQAVIRDRIPSTEQDSIAATVINMLTATHPGDPNNPRHWAAYARLAPHVLSIGSRGDDHPGARQLTLATISYLSVRGDAHASRPVIEDLLARWRHLLGPDHPDTLTAAANLTAALSWLVDHEEVHVVARDTLPRCRRVLGQDHPVTLLTAALLGTALVHLGRPDEAHTLGRDTYQRSARVLGPDHVITLLSAAALGSALALLGHTQAAVTLGQDTLRRSHQTLGPDHPLTLVVGNRMALGLAWLTPTAADRGWIEQTLDHARQDLGPDHPTTLASAAHLAFVLTELGDADQARTMGEDTYQRAIRTLGPDHQCTLVAAAAVSSALAHVGQPEPARTLGQQTLQRARHALGPNHLITLLIAGVLTSTLAASDHPQTAQTLGADTLHRARDTLGDAHPLTHSLMRTLNHIQPDGHGADRT